MKHYFLIILWLICTPTVSVWAKPQTNPKVLFTWLAIGSSLVVVALWIMIWLKRKRT